MILRLDETTTLDDVKVLLGNLGMTYEKNEVSFSSEDIIVELDHSKESLIGYISDDRANSYAKLENEQVEFAGHVDDDMKELFNIEPLLFGYPIYKSLCGKDNKIYTYRVEVNDKNVDYYTLSNSELDITDILI